MPTNVILSYLPVFDRIHGMLLARTIPPVRKVMMVRIVRRRGSRFEATDRKSLLIGNHKHAIGGLVTDGFFSFKIGLADASQGLFAG